MHNASGIGTYIKSIVPFLAANFNVTLIGNAAEIASYPWSTSVNIIDDNTRIYSIKEQLMLFMKVPYCDVFWSPHYNVPIFPIRAKKRIVTIHDVFHLAFYDDLSFKQKGYARLVINQAVRKSDVILTDSAFSASEIKKHTGHDVNHIVGCAIDFNRFHIIDDIELVRVRNKYNLPEKFILFVGNIKPHKNLKKLLLSLEKVSIINLVIVGKKDGFITGDDELAVLINNTAFLKNRVHFTGYIEDEDIPAIYNLALLFVFPSLYEGFGIPPLEAQACGCPVITSNAASLPEVCSDSVIYCDPYSVDDIANKINMVLSDGALQNELRARGFENIKRFSWKKSAQQIVNIIEEMK